MAKTQPIQPLPINQDHTLTRVINEISSNSIIRQELMTKLEERTKRHVITYVSSFSNHAAALVNDGDAEIIENILRAYGHIKELDLLVHSPGGFAESAERIVEVIYTYCDDFRVIIPKQAKSAATMVAMGSSEMLMSDTSEIGPIDPQILYGNLGQIAVQSIIKAYNQIKQEITEKQSRNENYDAELVQLSKIDPILLRESQKHMDLAKDIAVKLLNKKMFKKKPIKKEGVDKYLDDSETFSHGRLINWETAKEKLGLKIVHVDKFDESWKLIWEIYIRTTTAINQHRFAKLIEDKNHSLTTGVLPQA
jgi:ATP-dependent protease ClpP protease subunit